MMRKKKYQRGRIGSLPFWNGNGEKKLVSGRFFDGKTSVRFPLQLDQYLITTSEKGVPWNCLLSRGFKRFAKKNPGAVPHKVIEAYAIGDVLYVQSTEVTRAGQLPNFVKYAHDFKKVLRRFDSFSRESFLRIFGDQGIEVEISPPRKATKSRPRDRGERDHRQREPRPIDRIVARGAYRRALDAGLLYETRD